jgi:hypothetical protein
MLVGLVCYVIGVILTFGVFCTLLACVALLLRV